MDGRCDQFQKYLHSSGAIKAIIDALVSLYYLESWPENPIDFICRELPSEQNEIIASLTNELEDLQKELQYQRIPGEEFIDDTNVEISNIAGEASGDTDEHEAEVNLISSNSDVDQKNKESGQEIIQLPEEQVSQEDKESIEKPNEINEDGSNILDPEQEADEFTKSGEEINLQTE